jgi:NAD(P)-dependent dehydrogenase (short-subunit alcohol dehydrogenase family)
MDLELTGKAAVVTGASRGIGLAIAETLSAAGARVVGAARTITGELEKAAVATVSADLSTQDGATVLVDNALEELGGIDILINNVGGGDSEQLTLRGFLDSSDDQWRHYLDINLSAVWTTRAALPSLIDRRGAIVNISSINSCVPAAGPVGYSEAKAALTAFGKRLSEEFGLRGVHVNTVPPGVVGTRIWLVRPGGSEARSHAGHLAGGVAGGHSGTVRDRLSPDLRTGGSRGTRDFPRFRKRRQHRRCGPRHRQRDRSGRADRAGAGTVLSFEIRT